MSSFDERQSNVTSRLQKPGQVNQLSPVEQIPFPDSSPLPGKTTRHLEYASSPTIAEPISDPGITQELADYFTPPRVTRILPDINTGALSFPSTETTTSGLRQPIVIRGTLKKKPRAIPYPTGRMWVISLSPIVLFIFISFGTSSAQYT